MEFESVIGLEVHAQLRTQAKIFCGCRADFGVIPNSSVCPVCLGLPGALPVLNREAVSMAVKAALALGCRVNHRSIFARKNYFYPDLPKGYQISQFDRPLAEHGSIEVLTGDRLETGNIVNRRSRHFRIRRLHLEEDAGKTLHDSVPGATESLVNLNRSGVPLIEIVSEPDFRSSQEAFDYLIQLRKILLFLRVCDGNMEEGSLRCDANISVRPRGESAFGTKVEIKNLNSFRYLQKALEYEIVRQVDALQSGGTVGQETRLWDETAGQTMVMRSKEEAHDYRYFPEPDLPPLLLSDEWLRSIQSSLPELPEARRKRLQDAYELAVDDSLQLTATPAIADYFESTVRSGVNGKAAAAWILGDLFYALKASGRGIEESPIGPERLGGLLRCIESGRISGKMAKAVLMEMLAGEESAEQVIHRLGMAQISDTADLERIVESILAENPKQVQEYRAGKTKIFGYLVGQVMKKTAGQANPQLLNELLEKALRET